MEQNDAPTSFPSSSSEGQTLIKKYVCMDILQDAITGKVPQEMLERRTQIPSSARGKKSSLPSLSRSAAQKKEKRLRKKKELVPLNNELFC